MRLETSAGFRAKSGHFRLTVLEHNEMGEMTRTSELRHSRLSHTRA